jgi:hypothetical protein
LRQKERKESGKALFLGIVGNWWQNAQNVGQNAMNGDQKDLLEKEAGVALVGVVQFVLDVAR